MLKKINYFIVIILSFEFISFIIGYGTHYEHYRVYLDVIVPTNQYILFIKKKKNDYPTS